MTHKPFEHHRDNKMMQALPSEYDFMIQAKLAPRVGEASATPVGGQVVNDAVAARILSIRGCFTTHKQLTTSNNAIMLPTISLNVCSAYHFITMLLLAMFILN
jgi:hypothetical protein